MLKTLDNLVEKSLLNILSYCCKRESSFNFCFLKIGAIGINVLCAGHQVINVI